MDTWNEWLPLEIDEGQAEIRMHRGELYLVCRVKGRHVLKDVRADSVLCVGTKVEVMRHADGLFARTTFGLKLKEGE